MQTAAPGTDLAVEVKLDIAILSFSTPTVGGSVAARRAKIDPITSQHKPVDGDDTPPPRWGGGGIRNKGKE